MVGKLSKKATLLLGITEEELFENIGNYFVEFVGSFGYGDVLALLGRQLRDFLNGLDNLHEYIKFSYPRIRAPSYFCCEETETGLVLLYRSKRKGLSYYTIGQLKSVAEKLYQLDLKIKVMKEEIIADSTEVSFKLEFDNRPADKRMTALIREEARLPAVSSALLYDIFPFLIIFGENMIAQTIGRSLMQIMPDLFGKKITDFFEMVRPMIPFTYKLILSARNNVFEILAIDRNPDAEDTIHSEIVQTFVSRDK
ncbi:E4.6.1.2 [Lepeophtheirus salmonis]|uniref:guanylate cyclase n=1 Tax=Lepeophtheirus salmonis TaxID=72036 RepID=A0A7R8CKF9_LEPSM|nr:E4.6.1.2 [Lepeophtheirus salmonis]CAF2848474.1 E4.6.1.2 [Lepeophtheirus salmonis]